MITRRHFLATSGSALASVSAGVGKEKEGERPVLSFGLMADCQFTDADTRGSRFYRESPRKLEEAIEELNQRKLAFSFHLGDFIDRDFASFDVLEPIAAKLRSKLCHALGNHDFDVKDEEKTKVLPKLGLETAYYSFRKEGFRFVVIDTTEVSTYRYAVGNAKHDAAVAEMKRLKKEGSSAAKPWNSRPGDEQVAWLDNELRAATKAKETVLLLGHHPVFPNSGHSVWNAVAMNELFQKHACAKVYINGHNHAGLYAESDGLHYLTLDGMLETEKTNAFAYADLYADRLEIVGFGRQESHVLSFRRG